MKTPENINELIAKFFAGEEMTSLEKEQFQEWKKETDAVADGTSDGRKNTPWGMCRLKHTAQKFMHSGSRPGMKGVM